jgi:1,4-alpha-glucan branching enzyme
MINRTLLLLCLVFSVTVTFSQQRGGPMTSPVIYEVNVRQFSEKGSFVDVTHNLKRLKSIGVDIVCLMPVYPIGVKNRKGEAGSLYSVKDYREINPDLGDSADLRRLVKTAHDLGMKVIIDWVGHQTACDHNWIKQHPEYYVRDAKGKIQPQADRTDVVKLDYTHKELRTAMISNMKFWVDLYQVDGFRCDQAFLIPRDFWEEARMQLETTKPMFMVAQMESNEHSDAAGSAYFDKAFNTSYGWSLMNGCRDLAEGKKTLQQFRADMQMDYRKFPDKMTKLFFTTHHDENNKGGTIDEVYGKNWKLYATLCYTLPKSIPLMHTGEEAGIKRQLPFFEKDPILRREWADTSRYGWYRSIIHLRHTNIALWNMQGSAPTVRELMFPGADSVFTNSIYAFSRTKDSSEVIVITNFSSNEVLFKEGMLRFDPATFKMLFDDHQFTKTEQGGWILKPNENVIFYKAGKEVRVKGR